MINSVSCNDMDCVPLDQLHITVLNHLLLLVDAIQYRFFLLSYVTVPHLTNMNDFGKRACVIGVLRGLFWLYHQLIFLHIYMALYS